MPPGCSTAAAVPEQPRPLQASQAPACLHSPHRQDADKLEPGAFYLDRRPQAKHLLFAGTKYSAADVDRLWAALELLAAPALPAAR